MERGCRWSSLSPTITPRIRQPREVEVSKNLNQGTLGIKDQGKKDYSGTLLCFLLYFFPSATVDDYRDVKKCLTPVLKLC